MKLNNLVIFVTIFSTGVLGSRVIIPLVSKDLGANSIHVGIIVSLFSILPFFFSIKIGEKIDSMNYKFPMYLGVVLGGIGLIIPFIHPKLVSIILSQLICGVSHTIFALSGQRFAGLAFGREKSHFAIAQFSLGMALGTFIGPLLAGMLSDLFDYYVAFAILGILTFTSIFFVFFLKGTSDTSDFNNKITTKKSSALHLLSSRQLRTAILLSTIVLFAREIFTTYFPVYADELGYSSTNIGFVVSVNTIAAILIRIFLSNLLKNYSVTKLVTVSIIYAGLILFIMPFFDSLTVITILSFLLGLSLGLGQPLSIMMTVDALSSNSTGGGLGLRITFNRLTQVVAPIALGGAASLFGISSVFWITSFFVLGMQSILYKKVDDVYSN